MAEDAVRFLGVWLLTEKTFEISFFYNIVLTIT